MIEEFPTNYLCSAIRDEKRLKEQRKKIEEEIKNTRLKSLGGWGRCTCDDWKEGMDELYTLAVFAKLYGLEYHGKSFTHCPWCGKPRPEEEK